MVDKKKGLKLIKQRIKRKIIEFSLFITVSLFILFPQIALGFNEQQLQNESNSSEPLAEMEQAIIEIKKSDEPVPIIPLIPSAAELTEEQEKYVNLRIDEKNRAIDLSLLHFRSKHKLQVKPINKEAIEPLKASGGKYQLIQFYNSLDKIDTETRNKIEKSGIVLLDYLPNNAFYSKIPPDAFETLSNLIDGNKVRYVGIIPDEAKIQTELSNNTQKNTKQSYKIILHLFEEPTDYQLNILKEFMNISSYSNLTKFVYGSASGKDIEKLYKLDFVKWVEEETQYSIFNNDATAGVANDVLQVNGYTGSGVRVAVADSGIAQEGGKYHDDLSSSRVADQHDFKFLWPDDDLAEDGCGHGTHVAGTIGGRGLMNNKYRGMAPDITFLIYKLFNSNCGYESFQFDNVADRAAKNDADIMSNSWGGGNGEYTSESEIVDKLVRGEFKDSSGNSQYMSVVIAAGNDNKLVNAPGTAKNAITVGAAKDGNYPGFLNWPPTCGDFDWPAAQTVCFTNYGPLDIDKDGNKRVKPDIIAPGVRITSTTPWYPYKINVGSYYGTMDGTSMATPVVSGAIATLIQANPWVKDWPEMVKARVINTAIDAGNPQERQGRGMIDSYHMVYSDPTFKNLLWKGSSLDVSTTYRIYYFDVPSGFKEVRVTLTWSDPASVSPYEVTNDLDLWIFDGNGDPVGDSNTYDDTVEHTKITSGAPGRWMALVKAYSINKAPQYFGLSASAVISNPSFSLSGTSDKTYVSPNDYFKITTQLSNDGYTSVGSYISVNLPSGFSLESAEMYRADGNKFYYPLSEIYRQGDTYYLAIGEVVKDYPRKIDWTIRIPSNIPEGSYNINFKAAARNTASSPSGNVAVFLDKTPPTGSILIDRGAVYTTSTTVTLSLTYNDATSGVDQVRYSNDGVWDTENWETPALSKPWTLTGGDGTKNVYYQIKDKAGMLSQTYSDSIILDTTDPTGSITINNGATYTTSTSVTLSLTYSDSGSGVDQVRYSNDGIWDSETWEAPASSKPWTLTGGYGTKTVYYQIKDKVGRLSQTYSDTIELANTPVGANVKVELANANMNVLFANVIESGQTSVSVSTTGTPPPAGFDLAGNYYDLTTSAKYSGNINVCINYNEAQVTKENTLKLFHYENSKWADVTTSLDINANIICGTVTGFSEFIAVEPVDITAPTTTAVLSGIPGNNGWNISDVQITLTATDNEGGLGVNKTEYSLDGTNWIKYTHPFAITDEGITTVYYRSTDNAGNVEPTKEQIIKIDKTKPSISISEVTDGSYYNLDVTPVIAITDTNLDTQSITLNGAPFVSGTIISAEGSYALIASGTDKAGNSDSKTVNFVVDKTKPGIDISGVTEGSYYNLDVTPVITITDANLDTQSITLNGAPFVSGTIISAEGSYTLVASGTDKAGNSDSKTVNFVVDKTKPSIDINGVTDGSYYNLDVTPVITITDSNLDTQSITLNGAPFTSDTVVSSEGSYALIASGTDKAGNSDSKIVNFVIDETRPDISISGVSDDSYYNLDVTPVITITDANLDTQLITLNGAPFVSGTVVSAEGSYALIVSAMDKAGNSDSKTLNFVIDRTAPEASIGFDAVSKDIEVYNNETGGEADYTVLPFKMDIDVKVESNENLDKGWELRQYTIEDPAKNSLILVLNHKKEGKEAKVEVISMQYNGGAVITAAKNKIQAEYSEDENGAIKELGQKIDEEKLFSAQTKYSARKDETEIKMTFEGQVEQKETRVGIGILELLTNKGGLRLRYY